MRNCEQALDECAARPGQYKIAKDAKYTFQPGDQVTDNRLRRYVAPETEFAKRAYTLFCHSAAVRIGWEKYRHRMATFSAAVYPFLHPFF